MHDIEKSAEVLIRPPYATDTEALGNLLGQLGYPQNDQAALAAWIRRWGTSPANIVYVAVVQGKVLGLIAIQINLYFERVGCSFGRVIAMVVSDEARRQGVGSRLLARAEHFAIGHGCIKMELTSAADRSDAHAFYDRSGYRVVAKGETHLFRKDLAAPSDS